MTTNSITVENLKRDNNSPQALEYQKKWNESFSEKNIIYVLGCSDPRLLIARNATADIRSIGAAALPELYSSVLNKKINPRSIIVVVHHDGESVHPGKMPKGCGGLNVKAVLEEDEHDKSHQHDKIEYSSRYIGKHIVHQDPFIQGVFTGEEIAELSRKPVMVATEDHRTGNIFPLATFLPREAHDLLIRSAIPLRSGFEGRYNPKKIYRKGIPYLPPDQIPNEFAVFMTRHQIFVDYIKKNNPNLYKNQKLINPSVVALTTKLMPMQARFPKVLGAKPNTLFKITIQKVIGEKKGEFKVKNDSLDRAFDQMHYAFSHALEHKGNPKLGFANLYNNGTFIIEGDNAEQVEEIVSAVLKLPYIKEWIKIKGNKIITLQTSKGHVNHAKQLKI